jgi:hypothetical protein
MRDREKREGVRVVSFPAPVLIIQALTDLSENIIFQILQTQNYTF